MGSPNIPFTRGQNAVFKLYQDNKPVSMATKNWEVDENATETAEGVNGEDRDRLDKVTNYFSITFDAYMESDLALLRAYISAQDEDDAANLPKKQSGAMLFKHRDGTRSAFTLQEMKVGPMKISANSRPDAVMYSVKVRCRYMKPVQSI